MTSIPLKTTVLLGAKKVREGSHVNHKTAPGQIMETQSSLIQIRKTTSKLWLESDLSMIRRIIQDLASKDASILTMEPFFSTEVLI